MQRNKILNFSFSPGLWQWLDKTVVEYSNWDAGEPNYSDYGVIQVSDGTWKTGSHWQNRGYICKTPKGETITFFRKFE